MNYLLSYLTTIVGLIICSILDLIDNEHLFLYLNIIYNVFIIVLIIRKIKKGMAIIDPLFIASIFMFLLPYGFPILFQYTNNSIRYEPNYSYLAQGMLYANVGFITLWYSYNSSLFNKSLNRCKKYAWIFVKKLNLNKTLVYIVIILSVVLNLKSIYNGNYGVLSTIYPESRAYGAFDQLEYLVGTGLKGVVFLQAWQYYKYKKGKRLFFISFCVLLLFQILAGYKGAVVMSFVLLFFANYLAIKKINIRLGIICLFALFLAYGLVNPYREYLIYTGDRPASITSIISCIVNGVVLQSQVISNEDVSVIDEIMSRFTSLPELAEFIEYKTKYGLRIPRDPDFLYLCYTIPAQLLVPRFLWASKPVNDLGVWWVSNKVVGNMSNSSSAFGPVGFLYLTFDTIAIILGYIIITYLLKLCGLLLHSNRDGAILTGVILLSSLYVNEAGFNTYIIGGIRFLIIGIIFQAIILKR